MSEPIVCGYGAATAEAFVHGSKAWRRSEEVNLHGLISGRTKEEFERDRDAFHAHLDVCRQCREQPMNLCPAGAPLLRVAALGKEKKDGKE